MARPDKVAAVAELTESFRQSNAAVLTEYRGLTVAQLKELRRTLAADARYAVVKNTLTKLAVREAGATELESMLQGPSAIAFVTGDPVAVAKGIRDFAKAHPALIVKGGLLDGQPISAEELRKLADLESREVLLAKLAGAMKGSLQQAVFLFAAPLGQMARLAGALQAAAAADPSILAGGTGTPVEAADAPAAEAQAEAPVEIAEAPAVEAHAEAPVEVAEAPAAEAPVEVAEAPAAEAPAEAVAEAPAAEAPAEAPVEAPVEVAEAPAAEAPAEAVAEAPAAETPTEGAPPTPSTEPTTAESGEPTTS
ncbi:MAG: large subunit ribosomal protein [Frankiales bacterium]|jgi:large subunit ribosomal protein L10|nr:large subunit ribosomal protein [Frankiales bacterium]